MRIRNAVLTLSLGLIGPFGIAAEPAKTPHPHFDDKGTLSWSVKLADAQAAAKASGKLIFIEYGRES